MKQNGFTLIELIGVVAILALIMVVTIPQLMSTMTKSNVKELESFAYDLETSAMTYVENERRPAPGRTSGAGSPS